MLTWTSSSTNPEHAARKLISAATWMHTTFRNEVWLWRGQADAAHRLEPGMHTRTLDSDVFPNTVTTVNLATAKLLADARLARLDIHDGTRLPDLALLANLQHFGAATPLLDVTTDPLIALWMVAFASAELPDEFDDRNGHLFGIRKPAKERWLSSFDARPYSAHTYEGNMGPSVIDSLGNQMWWYSAPDVNERLRIQRGSFLLGEFQDPTENSELTIPLITTPRSNTNWVDARLKNQGKPSNTFKATTEAFAIVVRGAEKRELRKLLIERSGLHVDTIYPRHRDKPFLSEFASGYGRTRSLEYDLRHK